MNIVQHFSKKMVRVEMRHVDQQLIIFFHSILYDLQ